MSYKGKGVIDFGPDLKREFKLACVEQGVTMREVTVGFAESFVAEHKATKATA